ncbi:MAG: hypothetical protein K5829_13415 [Treponema sp.]|nr:hypothetical protein [Treponema sp.]
MLTMKSRMHAKGFSVMDADELYFINGGSGTYNHGGPTGPQGPQGQTSGKKPSSTGQKIAYWATFAILAGTSLGDAPNNFERAAEQAAEIAHVDRHDINTSTK